ncbi:MAG: thioesterase family protein [Planctomycetaceae bacterium]|nr:thioesterase family protein [Planctomycetaceae bacterium]
MTETSSPVAALFVREGNLWTPQEASVGPWSPDALHGGPVAALAVSCAEELAPGDDFITTRLSLDFVRPVPTRPLTVTTSLLKGGRRVVLVDLQISDGEKVVAFARVQRTRRTSVVLPEMRDTGAELTPPPDLPSDFDELDTSLAPRRPAPFLRLATELRTPRGVGVYEPRSTVAWLRVYADLCPGVALSPAAAVAAAADYGNALGAPAIPGKTGVLFANADLTVHLARHPASGWVRMQPATTWLEQGIGHTRCDLSDELGMLGTSAVTLPLMMA